MFIRYILEKYSDFKVALHQTFPVVYDTKHLAFKIRKHQVLYDAFYLSRLEITYVCKYVYMICFPEIKELHFSEQH